MSSSSNPNADSFDPDKAWRDAGEARKSRNTTKAVAYGGVAVAAPVAVWGGYKAYNKWNEKPKAEKQLSEKTS
jgi:hypothetical protein